MCRCLGVNVPLTNLRYQVIDTHSALTKGCVLLVSGSGRKRAASVIAALEELQGVEDNESTGAVKEGSLFHRVHHVKQTIVLMPVCVFHAIPVVVLALATAMGAWHIGALVEQWLLEPEGRCGVLQLHVGRHLRIPFTLQSNVELWWRYACACLGVGVDSNSSARRRVNPVTDVRCAGDTCVVLLEGIAWRSGALVQAWIAERQGMSGVLQLQVGRNLRRVFAVQEPAVQKSFTNPTRGCGA
ncbi:uncharacterized protein EMH_0016680 [Eimeria mitis]|uniref:Uncharacterized protein n=1 Tax=Eimeria mitis TaxID=44415 RepID=U6KJJ2_9EIME|nr:uncharacterized protein EMH_0016680 [Eimeria mitis]CDJ36417.1 hypothetical protein EMH_0016680 [Eimeria mitis]